MIPLRQKSNRTDALSKYPIFNIEYPTSKRPIRASLPNATVIVTIQKDKLGGSSFFLVHGLQHRPQLAQIIIDVT